MFHSSLPGVQTMLMEADYLMKCCNHYASILGAGFQGSPETQA